MTFVLGGLRHSGNFLRKNAHMLNVSAHALQALFLLCRRPLPVRGLLRKSRSPGLPPLLLPSLQEGRLRGGSLGVHLVLCPVRLPLLLFDLGPARRVEVSLVARALLCLCSPFGSCREGGCSFAVDAPCPRRFLGLLSPLIAARSATR